MNRQQAHQLLDRLDPAQFHAVAQLLEVLTAASEPFLKSLSKAEFEDEELTPETAVQILYRLDRYITARSGDVKKLKSPHSGFRLRCGDYRVFFEPNGDSGMQITRIRHRREAYRSSTHP